MERVTYFNFLKSKITADHDCIHEIKRRLLLGGVGGGGTMTNLDSIFKSRDITLLRKVKVKVTQSCPTLCNPVVYTVHGILQDRIVEWVAFPFSRGFSQTRDQTQVSTLKWILYQLSHNGSPRILEWVAYPFSRGSSQPRKRTGVSCIAGGFFTN